MKGTVAACIFVLIASICFAQSKKKIRRYGIAGLTEVVTDYKNGQPELSYTAAEYAFDKDGETILEREYKKDGTLKYEEQHKFYKGNEIEEVKDYPYGEKEEEPYYKKKQTDYNRFGDKTEERKLNREGEVREREVYEYDSMGNTSTKLLYDKNGNLEERTEYKYDAQGLRILKTEFKPDGEIKERVEYIYEYR